MICGGDQSQRRQFSFHGGQHELHDEESHNLVRTVDGFSAAFEQSRRIF